MLPACELAYEYLRLHDRDDEAERYRRAREEQAGVLAAAATERSEVSVDDRLEPPNLPGDWREHVRKKIA